MSGFSGIIFGIYDLVFSVMSGSGEFFGITFVDISLVEVISISFKEEEGLGFVEFSGFFLGDVDFSGIFGRVDVSG